MIEEAPMTSTGSQHCGWHGTTHEFLTLTKAEWPAFEEFCTLTTIIALIQSTTYDILLQEGR
jgi:hypothetical protein